MHGKYDGGSVIWLFGDFGDFDDLMILLFCYFVILWSRIKRFDDLMIWWLRCSLFLFLSLSSSFIFCDFVIFLLGDFMVWESSDLMIWEISDLIMW